MAQHVAGQPGQPGTSSGPGEDLVQPGRRQRPAPPGPLEDDEHLLGGRARRSFPVQIVTECGEEPGRDRHDALPAALALGDEQPPLAGVDIGQPQPQHLTPAQPAQQHRQHHGPVPAGAQRRQQCVHLGRAEDARHRARGAHQRDATAAAATDTARGQAPGHRIGAHPAVLPRDQIGEQPRHAGQPAGHRPGGQPLLAVLQPHHRLAPPRGPLLGQEREHIRPGHRGGLLADDREEHLQVIRRGQPGVRPRPRGDERQIVIQQPMAQPDRRQLRPIPANEQTRHERPRAPSRTR